MDYAIDPYGPCGFYDRTPPRTPPELVEDAGTTRTRPVSFQIPDGRFYVTGPMPNDGGPDDGYIRGMFMDVLAPKFAEIRRRINDRVDEILEEMSTPINPKK